MRIVALIENTSAAEKLKAEHGLCLYVEKHGNKYLIDTGALLMNLSEAPVSVSYTHLTLPTKA